MALTINLAILGEGAKDIFLPTGTTDLRIADANGWLKVVQHIVPRSACTKKMLSSRAVSTSSCALSLAVVIYQFPWSSFPILTPNPNLASNTITWVLVKPSTLH